MLSDHSWAQAPWTWALGRGAQGVRTLGAGRGDAGYGGTGRWMFDTLYCLLRRPVPGVGYWVFGSIQVVEGGRVAFQPWNGYQGIGRDLSKHLNQALSGTTCYFLSRPARKDHLRTGMYKAPLT